MASVVVAATRPLARSIWASRRVCSWVASPISMSQFSLANFCAFASLFSMITNFSGTARQLAGGAAADASRAADDVVTGQTAYVALHAAPSKEALQLEF